jgi:hypothetical protein
MDNTNQPKPPEPYFLYYKCEKGDENYPHQYTNPEIKRVYKKVIFRPSFNKKVSKNDLILYIKHHFDYFTQYSANKNNIGYESEATECLEFITESEVLSSLFFTECFLKNSTAWITEEKEIITLDKLKELQNKEVYCLKHTDIPITTYYNKYKYYHKRILKLKKEILKEYKKKQLKAMLQNQK